jgi:hypothetical protein
LLLQETLLNLGVQRQHIRQQLHLIQVEQQQRADLLRLLIQLPRRLTLVETQLKVEVQLQLIALQLRLQLVYQQLEELASQQQQLTILQHRLTQLTLQHIQQHLTQRI